MAEKISADGRIYALDIQEAPLEVLRKHARDKHLHNVKTIRADLGKQNGSNLKNASVDLVLITHILFQIADTDTLLKEVFRILVNGGRLVIMEWDANSLAHIGPRNENRITKKTLLDQAGRLGFAVREEFSFHEYSYGMVFIKNNE